MGMNRCVYRAIKTPDGTVLESRYDWDYKEYTDANGEWYMIDGGVNGFGVPDINNAPAELILVYENDPIEKVREVFQWGTYGKHGDEPLHHVLLKDMTDEHIMCILEHGEYSWDALFERELAYRGVLPTDEDISQ